MPAQTETRKILIRVDTKDSEKLKEISDRMGALNKSTKSLSNNMSFLTNAFTGFLGFLGVREVVRMADEMQNLSNRLKITTAAGQSTSDVFEQLANLAERTNQPIGAIGDAYNRLALSLSAVKPRTGELIALSETLINSFRVAGATTTETANTMIQLGQAFSSGELRGQELRSVMEQNGVLAKILREEFGTDVYKKAEKGLIGVKDVLRLLADNFEKITAQAQKLAPTFDQVLTKSMNKLSIAVGDLNQQYQLSVKFADAMQFAIENLGIAAVTLATLGIATLITKIGALQIVADAFLLANPLIAVLSAIVVVGTAVFTNFDRIAIAMNDLRASANDLGADLAENLISVLEKLSPNKDKIDLTFGLKEKVAAARAESKLIREEAKERASFQENEDKRLEKIRAKEVRDLADRYKSKPKETKAPKTKEILAELNLSLADGRITLDQYQEELSNFNLIKFAREFQEGKKDVFALNKEILNLDIEIYNRKLASGTISQSAFNEAVKKDSIGELNQRFKAGKVSLVEYSNELNKLSDKLQPGSALYSGTASYIQSIGTISTNVADAIKNTFSALEDNLVDFVKTGEFNFKKFTESVLDDLTRIIIRAAIIRPLTGAILGSAAPTVAAPATPNAMGNVYDIGGLRKFASGGVVDSPTLFKYGNGGKGLMGEAGPEAIVPLKRAANGDLGVSASVTPVTVNIINNSNSNVEQRETTGPGGEKTIDIIIAGRVRDGIISGKFDSAFKQSYGINRKGS